MNEPEFLGHGADGRVHRPDLRRGQGPPALRGASARGFEPESDETPRPRPSHRTNRRRNSSCIRERVGSSLRDLRLLPNDFVNGASRGVGPARPANRPELIHRDLMAAEVAEGPEENGRNLVHCRRILTVGKGDGLMDEICDRTSAVGRTLTRMPKRRTARITAAKSLLLASFSQRSSAPQRL